VPRFHLTKKPFNEVDPAKNAPREARRMPRKRSIFRHEPRTRTERPLALLCERFAAKRGQTRAFLAIWRGRGENEAFPIIIHRAASRADAEEKFPSQLRISCSSSARPGLLWAERLLCSSRFSAADWKTGARARATTPSVSRTFRAMPGLTRERPHSAVLLITSGNCTPPRAYF